PATNEFASARSGTLDQLAPVYGHSSDALLIDMRDQATQVIPLSPTIELAVIDSGTRHEHATGGYNRRRAECEEACVQLGVASLRDIDERPLDEMLERLPPPLDRRVRHVVTENARVRRAVQAVRSREVLAEASSRSCSEAKGASSPPEYSRAMTEPGTSSRSCRNGDWPALGRARSETTHGMEQLESVRREDR